MAKYVVTLNGKNYEVEVEKNTAKITGCRSCCCPRSQGCSCSRTCSRSRPRSRSGCSRRRRQCNRPHARHCT